jgi:L-lactate dehydrogenase complex protein LldF
MAVNQSFDFNRNVSRALNDTLLRENLRSAMGSFIIKRKAVFPDPLELENLRNLCSAVKQRALSRLPELLEQLEKKCLSNGIRVHWAETTDEANGIILDIMRTHNADRMVKGKSMVSEEIRLNSFLKNNGIDALKPTWGNLLSSLPVKRPPTLSSRPSIRAKSRSQGSYMKIFLHSLHRKS